MNDFSVFYAHFRILIGKLKNYVVLRGRNLNMVCVNGWFDHACLSQKIKNPASLA